MSPSIEIDDSNKPLAEKYQEKEKEQIVSSKLKLRDQETEEIKVYKRRWLAVALYVFYVVPSTCQWIQYCVIGSIVTKYYNVSIVAVDWTAITFMACYIPFILPATYLMDRIGLRSAAILGSVLSCLGSWIKVFSVSRDRFWLTFLGQCVVASTQVFVLNVPGRLAGYWFASHEVSTASALCLFGTQMGLAVGFVASPLMVDNHEDFDLIGEDLSFLFRITAAVTTAAAVAVLIFFENEPPLPPSKIRAVQMSISSNKKEPLIRPIKRLLTNKSYVILCNSYGVGIGVLNAIATLLSQMMLIHFENGEKLAGTIGLCLTLMGMVAAAIFGFIIDKTHKFKETAVAVYFLTFCGQVFFAVAMLLEIKWMVYVAGMFLGFFLGGYLSLGYQLCIEYTYPEAEDIATGVLNIMDNVYGIVFVFGLGKMIDAYGDLCAHIGLCCALLLGFIMTVLTKDEQRRQKVLVQKNGTALLV